MKTYELTGYVLDYAVAICEQHKDDDSLQTPVEWHLAAYSSAWEFGGPIIEREKIDLNWDKTIAHPDKGLWFACVNDGDDVTGPAPLIAAMRCYVASKLGDQVDIPEQV
jgi:hypothetical protein